MNTHADCCSAAGSTSMPLDQARERILDDCPALTAAQWCPLREALGRVLAEDMVAPIDVPGHINSAMDGYALRFEDLQDGMPTTLKLVGRSLAGHPYPGQLGRGETVRVMTGAVLPSGSDTVIMQEDCSAQGPDIVVAPAAHRPGQHLRHPGDDLRQGQPVLARGRVMKAADLGLLASLGIRQVRVLRRLRVAFFSTGDELTGVGNALAPGQIYDSNRYTVYALLSECGCEPVDLGVVGDDPEALQAALKQAVAAGDVVITTGGVSVGDADHVKDVLLQLGSISFWKIAMKPGRPLTFGRVEDTLFFGLPGNPVSVMATFYQLVLPALRQLQGRVWSQPLRLELPCLTPLHKPAGRIEFQRGILREQAGRLGVESTGQQDSHILSSMSRADCFIVLPEQTTEVRIGEMVEVQLI